MKEHKEILKAVSKKQKLLEQKIIQSLKKQSSFLHQHPQKISPTSQNQKDQKIINKKASTDNKKLKDKCLSERLETKQNLVQIENSRPVLFQQQHKPLGVFEYEYFNQVSKRICNKEKKCLAEQYSFFIHQNLKENIMQGKIKVQNHRQDIKNLLIKPKLNEDEIKILQKRINTQIRNKIINLLDPFKHPKTQISQNNSVEKNQLNDYIANSVLPKEQHKKLIEKFKLSNKRYSQRQKERLFQIEQRQRSLSFEKKIAKEQKLTKQKEQRRISVQQNLARRKQQHEKFLEQEKISSEKYIQIKKKRLLYKDMEDKFKSQILIPVLEEKKMKLKEIRDFYKRYDIQEIKKHELQYLQKRSASSNNHESRNKKPNPQYEPPQKSKKLIELLEAQKQRAKIMYEGKKKVNGQNKLKQANFLSDLRIKFKPKIDQNKRDQLLNRLKSQSLQKNTRSAEKDIKQLGDRYLQEARKKIKRRDDQQKTEGEEFHHGKNIEQKTRAKSKQKTQGNEVFQRQNGKNQFMKTSNLKSSNINRQQKAINFSSSSNQNRRVKINESKGKQIKKIINSTKLKRQQKLQRLKIENERINQIYKNRERFFRENEDDEKTRQEAISLLLNSIQAKLGIIDVSYQS